MSRPIEAQVLQHYRTVNPSRMPVETPEAWEALVERRLRIFRDRLHLPPRLFRNAALLDVGCGTGEHTAVYASWGALVTGVEFNPLAIARLKQVFAHRGLTDRLVGVEQAPCSEWEPPSPPAYDLAVSDGVLHHLSDPHEGFRKLAAGIKPGGFLAVSTAPLPGAEQRQLMRTLVQRFAKNLDEAVALVRQWFPEYLERATRLGHRTEVQVVSDNFLTPQNTALPLADVLGWSAEAGLRLYRSWPSLEPDLADPASHQPVDWLQPDQREFLAHRATHWAYHREGDSVRFGDRFGDTESYARRVAWLTETKQIQGLLDAGDRAALTRYLPTCRVVGRGCCGVGEWWLVGVKP